MSSVVLMRILESAPDRYDAGMRMLTLGTVPRLQAEVARIAVPHEGTRVVEIGCGTGAVTELMLERGARVDAIDQSPEMLDRARRRLGTRFGNALVLRESTASEIDGLEAGSADGVVASLSLSEMSTSGRDFVIRAAARLLAPGGRFVVLDEVRPKKRWQRMLHAAVRLPLVVLTWVITGTTTTAIPDLCGELEAAGLAVTSEQRNALGTLAIVVVERAT